MKCLIDQTEMEEGYISSPGEVNVLWYSKKDRTLGIFPKAKDLTAFICPRCRKVEFEVEEKK